jgi:hypothetical protein
MGNGTFALSGSASPCLFFKIFLNISPCTNVR